MSTKKILFYGNCQLGAIARYFRNNIPEVDVQLCTSTGIEPFWNEPGLFAIWSDNVRKIQHKVKKHVYKKIQDCDIFVFQDHSGLSVLPELQTKFLHDTASKNNQNICMPDTRLYIQPVSWHCLINQIKFIRESLNVINPQDIIETLKQSNHPKLTELLVNNYPVNKTYKIWSGENVQRHEDNLKQYETVISMNDFMEDRYTKEILFKSFSHPGASYFEELLKRTLKEVGITDHQIKPLKENDDFAGFDTLDPRQFNFFTNQFPGIDYTGFVGTDLTIDDINSCINSKYYERIHIL